jgi:hypothetical protein
MILLKLFLSILISDLITGAVHWWEDAFGNPNWKYFGKLIVVPNLEHHQYPRKFIKGTFFNRVKLSFYFAIGIGVIFYFTGLLNYYTSFTLLYASIANECHAISHRTDAENGKLICWLQKIGLIQSKRMHGLHHSAPYDCNYCVQTNYLNPILNKIKFWESLEKSISLFGIKPTRGNPIRNGY